MGKLNNPCFWQALAWPKAGIVAFGKEIHKTVQTRLLVTIVFLIYSSVKHDMLQLKTHTNLVIISLGFILFYI